MCTDYKQIILKTTRKFIRRSTKRMLLIILLSMSTFLSFGQENPWATKKKGENPWVKTEETKPTTQPETETPQNTDTILVHQDTVPVLAPKEIKTVGSTDLAIIEYKSKKQYNASADMAGSIVTAALFNVIAAPVNLGISLIPTNQQKSMIEQYKEDHPNCTDRELKAVKRGIRKKRVGRAAGGTAIGVGAQILIILGLSTL